MEAKYSYLTKWLNNKTKQYMTNVRVTQTVNPSEFQRNYIIADFKNQEKAW